VDGRVRFLCVTLRVACQHFLFLFLFRPVGFEYCSGLRPLVAVIITRMTCFTSHTARHLTLQRLENKVSVTVTFQGGVVLMLWLHQPDRLSLSLIIVTRPKFLNNGQSTAKTGYPRSLFSVEAFDMSSFPSHQEKAPQTPTLCFLPSPTDPTQGPVRRNKSVKSSRKPPHRLLRFSPRLPYTTSCNSLSRRISRVCVLRP